ncbi:MAG: CoB--CoM heterodisulfide reductase iron-sulfur subunit B family protein [Deltaproteobacteria bacterium]|nr:CoB--CoM heterodisulfide reductase iron-sulfur subunit B family protein [Deltaproteobacteria bacterium]
MQGKRVVKPENKIPEIPQSVFLFRSCTGSLEYPGTENAVRETLRILGIEVVMDPDQTCCSGYLLTCSAHKPEVSLAVTARNLALVEGKNLDTYTFCNGCYGYLSELSHILLHNPAYLNMANDLVAQWGYHYEGRTKIFHVQEMWYRLRDRIADQVVRPLNGLKVGVHYGCHYLAKQYGILDDGGYPTFHEELIELMGGTPVFYKERQLCCGYAVGRGFTHREETVQPHLYKKFISAREAGVDLMTTVCPGCNVALDREQPNLNKRYSEDFKIAVIDLAQLIALTLGVPVQKLGFEANTVPLDDVLKKIGTEKGS